MNNTDFAPMATLTAPLFVTLKDGYDRRVKPRERRFRRVTVAEAKGWSWPSNMPPQLWYVTPGGAARQVRLNGKIKTWKRAPARIEVPLKYGMYDAWRETSRDGNLVGQPLDRGERMNKPRLRKGIIYFPDYSDARRYAQAFGYPTDRIISYQVGWAIQLKVSGAYVGSPVWIP